MKSLINMSMSKSVHFIQLTSSKETQFFLSFHYYRISSKRPTKIPLLKVEKIEGHAFITYCSFSSFWIPSRFPPKQRTVANLAYPQPLRKKNTFNINMYSELFVQNATPVYLQKTGSESLYSISTLT